MSCRRLFPAILFLAVTIAGCGGGDSTGPSITNISGTYLLNHSNLSGGGISCSSFGTSVSIAQTGSTFTGTYAGGTLSCTGPGGNQSGAIGNGTVVNGHLNGSNVSFDLDTSDWHLQGTLSGASMTGTATVRIDLGAPTGVIVLSGNWAASKQ